MSEYYKVFDRLDIHYLLETQGETARKPDLGSFVPVKDRPKIRATVSRIKTKHRRQ